MERKKVIKNYSMGKKDFRESFLCGFERREDQVCVCARESVEDDERRRGSVCPFVCLWQLVETLKHPFLSFV